MTVSTRPVVAGSAGSGDPYLNLPKQAFALMLNHAKIIANRVVFSIKILINSIGSLTNRKES